MDYNKNKTLLNMTRIDGFPLSDGICSIYYNSIFGISPDELEAILDDFLIITHSQVVQLHPGINEFR